MKVLLSWMREFAPEIGTDDTFDPFALGDLMSEIGLECEEVRVLGQNLDGIVVAKVLETRPHPDADKIHLVDVDAGDGEALQVACGAFNMEAGDLVPLATVGSTMPSGMEIGRRKMRGEWSNGMLCSSQELELGDDHEGILILPGDLELGTPVSEALGMAGDVWFDLSITPNRPDALSVIGIARDVAARLGVSFGLPTIALPTSGDPAADLATVEVHDSELCGRFTARVLSGIEIGQSPPEIARRLTLCGMRPINSIVDISNYVMLEYGQPSHTFDLQKVAGRTLGVRRARDGETLVTLDGQERDMAPGDGLIVDGDDAPIGIAGVMGGASTEISETTNDVLLELAWWDPMSIAKTSNGHGLRSEASIRFEKGVDPDIASAAADRFAELAIECGATLHPGEIRVEGTLPDRSPILVRTDRVNAILGTALTAEEMAGHLEPIGYHASSEGADLRVTLPTWRPDSTQEIDVIEEIARMHGYEHVVKTVPTSPHVGSLTPVQTSRRIIRRTLVSLGLDEVMPMPFLAPGDLERCGLRTDAVVVTNPLVTEESVLRTAVMPGLLGTLGYNAGHRNEGLSIFEIGNCYAQPLDGHELPQEWIELGVALGGSEAPEVVELAARVVEALGHPRPAFNPGEIAGLHPGRSAFVDVGEHRVGEVGEVAPSVAEAYEIAERVAWIRLDLDALFAIAPGLPQHVPISRYPSADVDLAFVVSDDVAAHDVEADLREGHDLVADVRLFDVFRGADLGAESRSLAYRVRFQAADRTLTDEEVGEARQALIDRITTVHSASLRG